MENRIGWIKIGGIHYNILKRGGKWRAIDERGVDCGHLGNSKKEFLAEWGTHTHFLEPETCGLTRFLEKHK